MKTYTVTVTGTWNMEVRAENSERAEYWARVESLKEGIDVELMNLEFEAFEEEIA